MGRPARVLSDSVLAYDSLILLLRAPGERTLSMMNALDAVVTIAPGWTLATILLPLRDVGNQHEEAFPHNDAA